MNKKAGLLLGAGILATLLFLPKKQEQKKEIDFYANFEAQLLVHGIDVLSAKQMAANLVGAIDGKKFSTNVGDIEIYCFDEQSPIIAKAKALGKISFDNNHFFNVLCNHNYILPIDQVEPQAIQAFIETDLEKHPL